LVDRPDKPGRKDILKVHLKKISTAKNLDVDTLAAMTPGMVGADLANLVNEAALLSVRIKTTEVGMPEFEEAVERVVADWKQRID
jgi:cell division protease FtsH